MIKKGFTLIEILVVMAIVIILTLVINDFLIGGFRATTFNYELQEAIDNARKAMETMTIEIRGINNSEKGDYPLSEISTSTFAFYNDIDKDGKRERVRYYLSNKYLKKDVVEPGLLNDYSGLANTTVLADYINNGQEPIFIYYDYSGATTSLISSVRLINMVLKIDVNPERSPQVYRIESDVQMRNLKDK